MVKVLFVCLGNICRSPLGEGVLRHKLAGAGLDDAFDVDSAGTSNWHVGEPPDERAQEAAQRRGFDISQQRARQLQRADFERFDHVLVMDQSNLTNAMRLCPPEADYKLRLFLDYAPGLNRSEVPDPYYGGAEGFDRVIDMLDAAADGFLASLQEDGAAR